MLNEQFTRPTPCSRIDQPGFVLAHQIFTDKVFQFRPAAQEAMQQTLRKLFAFFSPKAMALMGF